MPESPEEMYDRITAGVGPDGRLALPDMSDWRQFPWEAEGDRMVAKVLQPPVATEEPRGGADPCPVCDSLETDRTVWENERRVPGSGGVWGRTAGLRP